jgi:hypothetical protein
MHKDIGRAAWIHHHHPCFLAEECDSPHPSTGTESGRTCTSQSGPHYKSQVLQGDSLVVSEKATHGGQEELHGKEDETRPPNKKVESADSRPGFKDQVRCPHQTAAVSGDTRRAMHSGNSPKSESKPQEGSLVSPENARDIVPDEATDEGEMEYIPSHTLEKVAARVPVFKDQIRQANRTSSSSSSSPPNVGCFPSNERRRIVDHSTESLDTTTATPTTLDHQSSLSSAVVPVVVNAVLVTTELLMAEEVTDVHWSGSESHRGFKGMMDGPASERQFWMRIILLAMLLNSLVVGGAVAGGFCAAGHCQGSRSSASLGTMAGTGSVAVPQPMPSAAPLAAAANASNPTIITMVDSTPTAAPPVAVVVGEPTADMGQRPKLPPSNHSTGTLELAPPTLFRTAVPTPVCANCNTPTPVPAESNSTTATNTTTTTTAPTPVPFSTAANGNDPKNTKHVLLVLVPILVGVETLIVVGLYLYYRGWKRQQQVFQQQRALSKVLAVNEDDDELRI